MTTVDLEQFGGGRSKRLDRARTRLFEGEFKRVTKSGARPWKQPPGTAPDCYLTVTSPSGRGSRRTRRVYALYGDTVLRDIKTDRCWQFYMGMLLMRWLLE